MNLIIKIILVASLSSMISNIYANENDNEKSGLSIEKIRNNKKSSEYKPRPPYIWADLLFGAVSPGITGGFKFNIDFYKGITGAFEMIESDEFCIMCHNLENWSQKNILIGKRFTNRYYYSYILAGVGKITGEKKGEMTDDGSGSIMFQSPTYEDIEINSICVPIEFGIVLAKYIGIGINMHININKDYPTAGILFNIPIGYTN